jgi:hypothetical protein
MTSRKYRMYGFVPYNISPIQQGIQFGHAVQEYNNLMMALTSSMTVSLKDAFDCWRKNDKTFIILNGSTTNLHPERLGTMNKLLIELTEAGILCATFNEPDLGDQLTAFVFLVDDRVYDKKNWPDYRGPYVSFTKEPHPQAYAEWKSGFSDDKDECERIVWLRDLLDKCKLA